MANPRTDIKDALVSALAAANNLVGARVYKGRHNVTSGTDLPLIYVWMVREETDTHTLTVKRSQLRTMSVAVDYWAQAASTSALEDTFDTACETVRTAALGSTTLGGKCQDVLLTSTEYLYEGDEAQPFGCARLTFTIKYFSTEP